MAGPWRRPLVGGSLAADTLTVGVGADTMSFAAGDGAAPSTESGDAATEPLRIEGYNLSAVRFGASCGTESRRRFSGSNRTAIIVRQRPWAMASLNQIRSLRHFAPTGITLSARRPSVPARPPKTSPVSGAMAGRAGPPTITLTGGNGERLSSGGRRWGRHPLRGVGGGGQLSVRRSFARQPPSIR